MSEHKNLAEALLAVQREMPVIGKDKEGFGYRYATLAKIISKVTPIMNRHGLVFMQPLDNVNGEAAIRTVILHLSGERQESVFPLHKAGMAKVNDAQQFGAAITYARRYGLVSALCVPVDDEDDDAACLTESPAEPKPLAKKPVKAAPAVRAGNPYGIPPEAWLKLDACKSYDELIAMCGQLKDDSKGANPAGENWNIGLNKFYKDRSEYLKDMERDVFGGDAPRQDGRN